MSRGHSASEGSERQAPNGYWYVKRDGKQVLKHHVIAEEMLGRSINGAERVIFKDKDRNNFDPSNIKVVPIGSGSTRPRKRLAVVEARIEELVAERNALLEELGQDALEDPIVVKRVPARLDGVPASDEKRCGKCHLIKPLSEYYIYKGRPKSYCRSCMSNYNKNNVKKNAELTVTRIANAKSKGATRSHQGGVGHR